MDIEKLLAELRPQFDVKLFSEASAKVDGAGSGPSANYQSSWSERFFLEYIINHSTERDDLVFFVKRESGQEQETVEVLRRTSKLIPAPSDGRVLWDQTFYLNLILHEFEYHVTCAAITVDPETGLLDSTLMKISQQVYPSPSKRRMDKKGDCDVVYPNIMFCLDNFEELFASLHISSPGQRVAVQLIAVNKRYSISQLVFLGALRYSKLLEIHAAAEQKSHESKFSVFSLRRGKVGSQKLYRYFRMRGPLNKGHAEMAIWKVQATKTQPSPQPLSGSTTAGLSNGNGPGEPLAPPTVARHMQGVGNNSNKGNPELRQILKLDSPSTSSTANADAAGTSADHFSNETRTRANLSDSVGNQFGEEESQGEPNIPRHLLPLLGQNRDVMTDSSESGEAEGDSEDRSFHGNGSTRNDTSTLLATSSDSSATHQVLPSTISANSQADMTDYPGQKHDREGKRKGIHKKKSLSKISKKREKSSSSSSPMVFAYLTYVQLPWYFLLEDILHNTKEQIFQV